MDEERGVRRTRRGRNNSDDEEDEMTSLSPASEHESESEDLFRRTREEDFSEDGDDDDGDHGGERTGFLRGHKGRLDPPERKHKHRIDAVVSSEKAFTPLQHHIRSGWDAFLHRTLLPDTGLSIRGHAMIEASGFATKLLKFICWTFVSIGLVHVTVAHLFDDRDKVLKIAHIWRFESDLIVRDCFVFFVVGRLWEKQGIDHLAWMGTAVLANVYFESQNFVWFLQHSVALFEMHCIWPWELWIFALVLVIASAGLVAAHALKAWRDRLIGAKLTEVGLCVLFFMAPMITSDYFHLHHWYAGWLMGMQFNYNVWWSRLAMAWCWGMYVNGIAVYGRDPVLTCEYAYFITIDNRCPYISCYLEGLADANNTSVKEMVPVDWRNCSATDAFHP